MQEPKEIGCSGCDTPGRPEDALPAPLPRVLPHRAAAAALRHCCACRRPAATGRRPWRWVTGPAAWREQRRSVASRTTPTPLSGGPNHADPPCPPLRPRAPRRPATGTPVDDPAAGAAVGARAGPVEFLFQTLDDGPALARGRAAVAVWFALGPVDVQRGAGIAGAMRASPGKTCPAPRLFSTASPGDLQANVAGCRYFAARIGPPLP